VFIISIASSFGWYERPKDEVFEKFISDDIPKFWGFTLKPTELVVV
jgi:hypothetical protein